MSAPPRHRGAIVRAAATLFRRNGFAATGINEIAEAAVRFAGAGVVATLEKLEKEHDSASAMIRAYCRLLAGWMAKSGFRDGCPISTTLLESAPQSAALAAAGREAFAGWCAVIARALVRDGFGKAEAKRHSTLAVSAIEGALILARVEGSAAPIDDVAKSLAGALQFRAPARKRVAS